LEEKRDKSIEEILPAANFEILARSVEDSPSWPSLDHFEHRCEDVEQTVPITTREWVAIALAILIGVSLVIGYSQQSRYVSLDKPERHQLEPQLVYGSRDNLGKSKDALDQKYGQPVNEGLMGVRATPSGAPL
jgi:hypothetical protein